MKAKEDRFEESCEAEGRIRLGEAGWKARYYQEKMEAPPGAQDEVGGGRLWAPARRPEARGPSHSRRRRRPVPCFTEPARPVPARPRPAPPNTCTF